MFPKMKEKKYQLPEVQQMCSPVSDSYQKDPKTRLWQYVENEQMLN